MAATKTIRQRLQYTVMRLTGRWPFTWLLALVVRLVVPRSPIGTSGAIINSDGHILLLKHAFHGNHPWSLPGGWVGRGESPDDALVRELKEETGLDIVIDDTLIVRQGKWLNSLIIIYAATAVVKPMTLSFEIVDSGWFSANALPQNMLSSTYDDIRLAFARHKLIQEADAYKRLTLQPSQYRDDG